MDEENYQLAIDITETDDEKNKAFIGNKITNKLFVSGISSRSTDDEKNKVFIGNKIMNKLSPINIVSGKSSRSERFIKQVPKHLRNVNADAYKPQIVTIGPYYLSKKDFKLKEQKLRCLKMLLQRRNEHNVERYMNSMWALKEKALSCYPDFKNNPSKDIKFVEMMLLDTCFIVELFRNYSPKSKDNEPLFDSRWMEQKLRRDLLLPDNQIPFFLLYEFFKMTKTADEEKYLHGEKEERNHFLTMIFSFFVSVLHSQSYGQDAKDVPTTGSYPFFHSERFQDSNVKHLLSLVHDGLVDQIGRESPGTRNCNWKIFSFSIKIEKSGSDKAGQPPQVVRESPNTGTRNCNWDIFSFLKTNNKNGFHRRCATNLKEAGIKFKEVKSKSLLDIKFENGIMKIPRLKIDDGTESFFQNLIFYEQLSTDKSTPVINYMNFMDSLINSEKDVELLCQRNIIDNCLGDDQVVAKMFNRMGDLITLSSCDHYKEIYEKVNKHCNRRRNKWMANLRHNYFNTPWALISFLAGVLLLLLTVGQTVFSVLAYFE